MNKLLHKSGAVGTNIEVFHSLRGDLIDDLRKTELKDRSRRLQTGHELGDVHDMYGFRALDADEARRLASRPQSLAAAQFCDRVLPAQSFQNDPDLLLR